MAEAAVGSSGGNIKCVCLVMYFMFSLLYTEVTKNIESVCLF